MRLRDSLDRLPSDPRYLQIGTLGALLLYAVCGLDLALTVSRACVFSSHASCSTKPAIEVVFKDGTL